MTAVYSPARGVVTEPTELDDQEYTASKLPTEVMVAELWQRGVSITQIYGAYYALEEAANARSMTVEDAELAGMADTVVNVKERQPF